MRSGHRETADRRGGDTFGDCLTRGRVEPHFRQACNLFVLEVAGWSAGDLTAERSGLQFHETREALDSTARPRASWSAGEGAVACAMVRETTGHRDELATDGLGDEGSGDVESERCDPAHEVVGDRSEHRPGGVGVEVARGTVLETGAFLQVPDGEFDDGVTTVVDVEEDGVTDAVGDEGVVAVVGKERRTRLVEFGATNDQTLSLVVGLTRPRPRRSWCSRSASSPPRRSLRSPL